VQIFTSYACFIAFVFFLACGFMGDFSGQSRSDVLIASEMAHVYGFETSGDGKY